MKRLIAVLLTTIVFLLSACGKETAIAHFSTKEEALEHFIQNEGIRGAVDVLTTTKEEEVLAIQLNENTYFAGEVAKDKKGYAVERISANVIMEAGGGWELTSTANQKYTIYFEKQKENQHFHPLSNGHYYVSLVEGHQITEEPIYKDAIKDLTAVQ